MTDTTPSKHIITLFDELMETDDPQSSMPKMAQEAHDVAVMFAIMMFTTGLAIGKRDIVTIECIKETLTEVVNMMKLKMSEIKNMEASERPEPIDY